MDASDPWSKIEYPKQTSEWGRSLIDVLNTQFNQFQKQFDGVNKNISDLKTDIGKQFENLEKSIHAVKHVAQSALSLAEQNQNDITEIRTELRNTKKELTEVLTELKTSKNEMNYCKVNCDELKFECKTLKQHSNKLDNYSRRKNLVIRGIDEEKNESSAQCEQKVRDFMKNKLKLHNDTVDAMKFAGCHRLSGFVRKGQHANNQKRPIIIRFCNNMDKQSVWGAKSQLTDAKVSVSENYSADTEYNRNKLYMIYRKAKSIDKYKQKVFLNGDVLILENKRYSVDDLVDLPADLSPRLFSEKTNDKCYVFGGIHSKFNPFSNWYPCRIQHGGHLFKSVEQAYQHSKAAFVGDATSATKLLHTMDPAAAKKIGSKVAGVNGSNWDTAKNDIMKDLITKKFTDSDELKAELLATGNKAMVECGRDPYYACGLPIVHKDIFNQEKWTGKNVLGNILCTVRDIIRNG